MVGATDLAEVVLARINLPLGSGHTQRLDFTSNSTPESNVCVKPLILLGCSPSPVRERVRPAFTAWPAAIIGRNSGCNRLQSVVNSIARSDLSTTCAFVNTTQISEMHVGCT